MLGVLDVLEIRNASLRERLLAVDPGAAVEEAPAPAAGVELDASVLGTGELAPWLESHAGGPLGIATVDSWALGQGNVTEIALAAAGGAAAWFTPAELDEADERAFAAWAADAAGPKVVHNAKGLMRVFPEHGWTLAGVSMDTALAAYLVKPGGGPSPWTRCPWSTCTVSWRPPPPTASWPSAPTRPPRPRP